MDDFRFDGLVQSFGGGWRRTVWMGIFIAFIGSSLPGFANDVVDAK